MTSTDATRSDHGSTDYRRVLAIPAFRTLWLGSLLALIGGGISQVALPILVYDLTESASAMSVIFVMSLVPQALLSPFTGVFADTFDRRRLLIGSCAIRSVAVAILPFTTDVWHIAAIAVITSAAAGVFNPAQMAAVPTIVDPDQLVTALSAGQVASSITRVVGPAIGAALISISGTDIAFWIQAVLYVAAITMLSRLELPAVDASRALTGVADFSRFLWSEAVVGLRVVWQVPVVRAVCATEALWTLAMATLSLTAVVYVKEELDLGDRSNLVFGMLAVCMSFGAVIGAVVARHIERRGGRLALMLIGYLAPLLLVPAVFTPPLPVLFACWFFLGFADAWLVIAMFAYVIESVPAHTRGRTFAIWQGIIAVAGLGTYALVGQMTERLGPQITFMICGMIVATASPLALWLSGALDSIRAGSNKGPEPAGATG